MNSVKIVHTADLHLTYPDNITDKLRRQLAQDALSAFYSIIDFCKEYKPDLLLISGDLFSTPKESDVFAGRVFEKFSEISFVKVIITPGNHDYLTTSSPYNTVKLPDNVHVFSEFSQIILEDKNASVCGTGFSTRFIKEGIFKSATNDELINICAIHGEVTNSASDYNPVSVFDIQNSGYDYVALGHIHSFSGIKNAGKTFYAYPGTPQGQGFDEKDEKGIIYGSISKDFVDLQFKKISKRSFIEFSFDISEYPAPSVAFTSISNYMEQNYGDTFSDNLYRINLVGIHKENHILYVNYISENLINNLFYCEINDCTKPDTNLLKSMIDETSVKGIYIKKMLDIIDNCDEKDFEIAKKALYIGLEVLNNEN